MKAASQGLIATGEMSHVASGGEAGYDMSRWDVLYVLSMQDFKSFDFAAAFAFKTPAKQITFFAATNSAFLEVSATLTSSLFFLYAEDFSEWQVP